MVRSLPPENFHVVQTTAQRFRLSDIDRQVRRNSLSMIYDALGVTTFRQRLMALRTIVRALSGYHFDKSSIFQLTTKEFEGWFNGIADHAEAMADLIAHSNCCCSLNKGESVSPAAGLTWGLLLGRSEADRGDSFGQCERFVHVAFSRFLQKGDACSK
jgi:hypothetical protein